jgi:hypothetical protein
VSLPTGGKKKKLNVKVAATEAAAALKKPQTLAMIKTRSKYAKPTVVAFAGRNVRPAHVTSATPKSDTTNRITRQVKTVVAPNRYSVPIGIFERCRNAINHVGVEDPHSFHDLHNFFMAFL